MKSLQDLYHLLVRDVLDLEKSANPVTVTATAQSSFSSSSTPAAALQSIRGNNSDLAMLLLNRCVVYEQAIKGLEEERNSAQLQVIEFEQRLNEVHQLVSNVASRSKVNGSNLPSSSSAIQNSDSHVSFRDSRVDFESQSEVDRRVGRSNAPHSDGATSRGSSGGVSEPLSITSSLPDTDSAAVSAKRKRDEEAEKDSAWPWSDRLSKHSVQYSDNKQERQAE